MPSYDSSNESALKTDTKASEQIARRFLKTEKKKKFKIKINVYLDRIMVRSISNDI